MRRLAVSLALLLLAGCGGAAASETTTTQAVGTVPSTTAAGNTAPTATSAPETTTTAGAAETVPDGPIAPDFQLELADGSTFALSAVGKPVYMVFWAEW